MEVTCNDAVFGEMSYKHRWYKQDKISLFGTEWAISTVAKAYSGKPITDQQRDSYNRFTKQATTIAAHAAALIIEYINSNCEELSLTWAGARMVNRAEDLPGIVQPTSLLFKQDGTTLILFNCAWDEEHGLAVQVFPDYEIGCQDVFL